MMSMLSGPGVGDTLAPPIVRHFPPLGESPMTTRACTPGSSMSTHISHIPDEVLDRTIAALRAETRSGALRMVVNLGRIIIENLYQGDLQLWRSQGAKANSFRRLTTKLEQEHEVGLSASALSRACGIYVLVERLGEAAVGDLSASHLAAVLRLPDPDQRKLLEQARAEQWSTRELERVVANRVAPSTRGRKPLPVWQKAHRPIRAALDEAIATLADGNDPTKIGAISPAQADQLAAKLAQDIDRLLALREALIVHAMRLPPLDGDVVGVSVEGTFPEGGE